VRTVPANATRRRKEERRGHDLIEDLLAADNAEISITHSSAEIEEDAAPDATMSNMSKHAEAELILKLYDLRREPST
jgi:hypothetical protein